ncbi:Ccc1 family [Apodospora peruviana]|uniref:Ccc1 family n=1 Tax=Apodospora peruviana TaxID=516989 RepID=A0AAE0I5W5_9PEZI|nr:Ccc1 family [Apodospora peruviana]
MALPAETLACIGGQDILTSPPSSPPSSICTLPSFKHLLADFTLGFADGLTVPFALTAGLSSLGQTNTVIYAGMAEICAGSISMGIGGYLAARGENRADADTDVNESSVKDVRRATDDIDSGYGEEEEEKACRRPLRIDDPEKMESEDNASTSTDITDTEQSVLAKQLASLHLPAHLEEAVLKHARQNGYSLYAPDNEEDQKREAALPSAVISGLSVSLGYLLGGILPLFPYFFVNNVGDGLVWSFVVCVVALFVFGFTKDIVMNNNQSRKSKAKRIRASLWEGIQMVVLGSIAALAAVLCVKAFEGLI